MARTFMPKIFIVHFLHILCLFWAATNAQSPNDLCSALVEPQGSYQCEEIKVNTDDGFVLGIQRISAGTNTGRIKQPVFLMHGILSGGDTWLLNPPAQSLGFILADAGYDVWIGNFRTTNFCHGHVIYTPTDKEYWDWSIDELAEKDLVTLIGFVYRTTNKRMHYVGFSQGTQTAFAALSQGLLVEWLDKMVMMAPVAYVKHTTTPIGIIAGKLRLDKAVILIFLYFSLVDKEKCIQALDLWCCL
eukprot:c13131_g1_i1 orf=270-1004(+)